MIKKILQFFLSIFFNVLFRLSRDQKNSIDIERVTRLYQKEGFSELFTKIRFWDAPFEMLEKIVSKKGKIIDLGCGDGLLANYLALKSDQRQLLGVDKNLQRLKSADKGLKNTHFITGDVLRTKIATSDSILMVHLLHHLSSFETQETIIQKSKENLKKGGQLVIVEIDRKPFLKYLLTWIVDILIFPILFEGRLLDLRIYYRKSEEWKTLLEKLGFNVKIRAAHQGKPFSHIILVGTKR